MRWFFLYPCFGILVLATDVLSQTTPSLIIVSIASKLYAIDPADIVLAGTTLSADGPAVTIDGAIVSEDRNEDVFVDGVEVFTELRDPSTTKLPSFLPPTSQGKSCISTANSVEVLNWKPKVPRLQAQPTRIMFLPWQHPVLRLRAAVPLVPSLPQLHMIQSIQQCKTTPMAASQYQKQH